QVLIWRWEGVDVTEVARRPVFVQRPPEPFVHLRVAPRAQPTRRVDRLCGVVRPVGLAPPRLGEEPLRGEPRGTAPRGAGERLDRQYGIERVLVIPDFTHDAVGQRVGQELEMTRVAAREDRRVR